MLKDGLTTHYVVLEGCANGVQVFSCRFQERGEALASLLTS